MVFLWVASYKGAGTGPFKERPIFYVYSVPGIAATEDTVRQVFR